MVDRSEWDGLLSERTDPSEIPVIEVPLQPSPQGGSGAFLAADGDGKQWWVKPLNNQQLGKVIVTEHVVGRVGSLIDAPVCEVAVVELPDEISGWEFRPGAHVEAGLAHGSAAIHPVSEDRSLVHRDRNDNQRRHAGIFAVYDWCWGGDPQWLYSETNDLMIYSHDHGWYFPEEGNDWSEATLTARADEERVLSWPTDGLDSAEVNRLAGALDAVARADLVEILSQVPLSWPATTIELEALGWFLERRAPQVARRLTSMFGVPE